MKVEKCHVGKQEMDDSCELCINGKLATCQVENMKEEEIHGEIPSNGN